MNSRQVSCDTINDNYVTIAEASPHKSQILISYNPNLKVRPGHFEIIRFILRNTCLILLPPTSVVHEDQERRWQQSRKNLRLQPKVRNSHYKKYKTIGDGGITVDFWIIKVLQITGIIEYLGSSSFFGSLKSILSFEMTLRLSDQFEKKTVRSQSSDFNKTYLLHKLCGDEKLDVYWLWTSNPRPNG